MLAFDEATEVLTLVVGVFESVGVDAFVEPAALGMVAAFVGALVGVALGCFETLSIDAGFSMTFASGATSLGALASGDAVPSNLLKKLRSLDIF